MDQITDSQELARRFNEDEAVWQRYEYRRRLRLLQGIESLPTDEILDNLDWIEAERERRQVWCVGARLPRLESSSQATNSRELEGQAKEF